MPKLLAIHEVDDVAHWLASPKREEILAGIGTNITPYAPMDGTNLVAVSMDVEDMDALDAVMKSEAGAEAMKYDGVRAETMKMFKAG